MLKRIALFVIALTSARAIAFTLLLGPANQVTTGWNQNTVTFDIDQSCSAYLSQVYSAIDTASNTWGKVPTSALSVKRGLTVSLPNPITAYVGNTAMYYAPVGNPVIYCDANFTADSGEDADSIPGFATGQNMNSDGQIVGGLLVLNVQPGGAANITTLDSTLVGVVLTHEIGHCLGLGHSADPNALMYYASGPGRKVVLAKDDMDGITYLYPKQELGKTALGCSSVSEINRRLTRGGGSGGSRQFFKTVGPDLTLLFLFILWIQLSHRVTRRRETSFAH